MISDLEGQPAVAKARKVDQTDVLNLLKMIRPQSMGDTRKVRIGGGYDGAYVLPETALACDAVVSIGIGRNVSFDLHLANLGARILQFDHTVDGPPIQHANFIFHKLGWGARTEGEFLSFNDICARLAELAPRHPLLKFDVEGAEYDAFETIDPKALAHFEVITCEIHGLNLLGDPSFYDKVQRLVAVLTSQHVPVHLHGNNYARVAVVEGVPTPYVLEISLLRRNLGRFLGVSTDPIPGPLDRPNRRSLPDICLNPFG